MNNKFLKKSLRLLALFAITGICQQVNAVTVLGDDGVDYHNGAGGQIPTASNSVFTLFPSAAAGHISLPVMLSSVSRLNLFTMDAGEILFQATGGITAVDKSEISLFGNGRVDFSAAPIWGPITANSFSVLNLNANTSTQADSDTLLPGFLRAANATNTSYFAGNWNIVSNNNGASIDTSSAADEPDAGIPACRITLNRNLYVGGSGTVAGARANASYFGTFSSTVASTSVVTGAGTLILGKNFGKGSSLTQPALNCLFTAFTGAVQVTGTQHTHIRSVIGATGSLILGGRGAMAEDDVSVSIDAAQTIGEVKPIVDGAIFASSAAITIASLDLTERSLTLRPSAAVTITKIQPGSNGTLTIDSTDAVATTLVKIGSGFTTGGTTVTGANKDKINLQLP